MAKLKITCKFVNIDVFSRRKLLNMGLFTIISYVLTNFKFIENA